MATAAGVYTPAQLATLARQAFAAYRARHGLGPGVPQSAVDTAVAVALAESRGRANAISSTGDYGLWQINLRAHPQYHAAQMLNPSANAAAMAEISSGGTNWQPWTTYRTGAYQASLGAITNAAPGTASSTAAGGAQNAAAGWIPSVGSLGGLPGVGLIPDAVGAVTSAWVKPLLEGTGELVLTAILAITGLALAGIGVVRLTGSGGAARRTIETASQAGTVAALVA